MKKYKQVFTAVCLFFAFGLLTACGAGEDGKNTVSPSKVPSSAAFETERGGAEKDRTFEESTGVLEGIGDDLKDGADHAADWLEEGVTRAEEGIEKGIQDTEQNNQENQ